MRPDLTLGVPAFRKQMQRSRLTPWIGLVAPPVAWAVHQQVAQNLVFFDCRLGNVALIASVGATMAVICAVSSYISWSSRREDDVVEFRMLAGYIGTMSGAVFFLALAFQTIATLLLPACHR
jgi:hypothetical protein